MWNNNLMKSFISFEKDLIESVYLELKKVKMLIMCIYRYKTEFSAISIIQTTSQIDTVQEMPKKKSCTRKQSIAGI